MHFKDTSQTEASSLKCTNQTHKFQTAFIKL